MKTMTKNRKRKGRSLKMVVFKTIVSLTIVNDDHSLTIVKEERKPT